MAPGVDRVDGLLTREPTRSRRSRQPSFFFGFGFGFGFFPRVSLPSSTTRGRVHSARALARTNSRKDVHVSHRRPRASRRPRRGAPEAQGHEGAHEEPPEEGARRRRRDSILRSPKPLTLRRTRGGGIVAPRSRGRGPRRDRARAHASRRREIVHLASPSDVRRAFSSSPRPFAPSPSRASLTSPTPHRPSAVSSRPAAPPVRQGSQGGRVPRGEARGRSSAHDRSLQEVTIRTTVGGGDGGARRRRTSGSPSQILSTLGVQTTATEAESGTKTTAKR